MYSTVIDRALDEIVAEKKGSRGRSSAKGGSSGSHRASGFSGRWQHDRFEGVHDTGRDRKDSRRRSGVKLPTAVVRILLANLSPQFNQIDLEELVEPYNGKHPLVHYNEKGEQVGTAQFATSFDDAQKFMKDLHGASIDDKRLKITLVDDVSTITIGTVRERIKFARAKASRSDGRVHRTIRGRVKKSRSSDSGGRLSADRPSWDQHDHRDQADEASEVKPKHKPSPTSSTKWSLKKLSQEELDRQLDEYMKRTVDQQID
ncbi:unnamed protein product, partial [Mesorhabditis belari]|uniref:RRM domain-containing protein n=1 Tax=Mesorhabditis belari TaxID=2138241 RepID=A0AAF3FQP3_9BILA